MDNYCQNCKHWGHHEWEDGEIGFCALTVVMEDRPVVPHTLAYVDADYSGCLKTMPNFGCVQFEPNDTTDVEYLKKAND